jgi:hypothetical protein
VQYPPDLDPDPEEEDGGEWDAFWEQLANWGRFRDWQRYIRKDYIGFDSEYAHVRGEGRAFPDYNEAVRKLLAEYDFTRPLQLHKDPTQQDKLTTWVEYLGYECWLHYRCTQRIKRMQPDYHIAWKKLVDSNVLRPFETEEYVCRTRECGLRQQSEREEATRAVKSAETAAQAVVASMYKDAHNPKGACLTSEQRIQRMLAAKSRLEAAKESLALIKRRNDLVTEFKQAIGALGPMGYVCTMEDAKRHSLRIRWILDQVPLIEAESTGSSVAETGPDAICGTKRRLGHDADEETAHHRGMKKQRRDARDPGCGAGSGHQGAEPGRSREDAADDGPPAKRLRNGGRGLESPVGISDSDNTGLTENLQESETPMVKRGNGREHAVKTAGRSISKGNKSREQDVIHRTVCH